MSMYPGGYYPPPPPQPYQGYPGYPGYMPLPPSPKNGMGIAALILGIVALVSSWSVLGGFVFGIAAAITGFVGYRRVKAHQADNMAVTISGSVLGILAIIISVAFIAIWNGFLGQIGYSDYSACMREAGANQTAANACIQQFQKHINDTLGQPSPGSA